MSEAIGRTVQALQCRFGKELSDGNVGAEELVRAVIEALHNMPDDVIQTVCDRYSTAYGSYFAVATLWRGMTEELLRD